MKTEMLKYFATPIELLGTFNRYQELETALRRERMKLREDSRLCAQYIILGEYDGPELDIQDALQSVVQMMHEMNFLYRETKYKRFMRDLGKTSEKAKHYAVRYFLHECTKDSTDTETPIEEWLLERIPPRLRKVVSSEPVGPEELACLIYSLDNDRYIYDCEEDCYRIDSEDCFW